VTEAMTPGAERRPATVLAACVVTWAFSGITFVVGTGVGIAVLFARGPVSDEVADSDGAVIAIDVTAFALAGLMFLCAFMAVVAGWAALFAYRRSQRGRIVLAGLSLVTAVIGLVTFFLCLPLAWVGAGIATAGLLYTGGAREWYARPVVELAA
jgi:hypothetical protein